MILGGKYMAKKDQKKALNYQDAMKEALMKFDLKAFKKWCEKYNKPLWKQFSKASEQVQMATMCKCICNRTDMLATDACKKARKWLAEHNMRGQIF